MDPTTLSPGGGSSAPDVSVIVIVSGCVGGLFLIVLLVFIVFVICMFRKQMNEDNRAKRPSLRIDQWKTHPLAAQFADINEVDKVLWTDRGREANAKTDNPAFDKDDMETLDVSNLKFDSTDDSDTTSTDETESTSDMVEVDMHNDQSDDQSDTATITAAVSSPAADDGSQDKKQISILDMKTWGQPGTSRHNSMRIAQPTFHLYGPSDDDGEDDNSGSVNREDDTDFPKASNSSHKKPSNSTDHKKPSNSTDAKKPKTVSNPANDPRFQYTRVNPLVGGGQGAYDGFPFSGFDKSFGKNRDYGGTEDIQITDYDKYGTLMEPQRNQAVVNVYESGTRSTSSGLSLSLDMDDSSGKKMLWQKKNISGMGFRK